MPLLFCYHSPNLAYLLIRDTVTMLSIDPTECSACGVQGPIRIDWSKQVLDQEFGLVKCSSCSSLSSSPIPSDSFVDRFYSTMFDYRWYADHMVAKRRDAEERVFELRGLKGRRILDLGGGLGYLSEAFRSAGFDALTYDPFAKRSVAPPLSSFDTIVCSHVLEHIPDPLSFLKSSARYLAPEGTIVLSVPNASGEGFRKRATRWVWTQAPVTHIHHFTPSGLKALVQRAGFETLEIIFRDRWDANSQSDIRHAKRSHLLDSLWGAPVLTESGTWRKIIGTANGKRRFRELQKARSQIAVDTDLAEVSLVARKLT